MSSENLFETEVLVIGGGVAGCFAAIKARELGLCVTLVDKAYAGKSGSSVFGSLGWLAFNPEWGQDFDTLINTINERGEYINNREWSEIILRESWEVCEDLASWGIEFDPGIYKVKDLNKLFPTRDAANPPDLGRGMIGTRSRKTTPVLRNQVEKVGTKIMDRIMITDLLKQDGKVVGAIGFDLCSCDLYIFKAKATILAGGNNCFRSPGFHTASLTGDADSMAYRAGVDITGKEFPDFHFSLASYPAWTMPAYIFNYFTDAEGKRIEDPYNGMELPMAFTIHGGKGPIFHNLDAATAGDIKAMLEYVRITGNPKRFERIGLDLTSGGKHSVIGGASAGRSSEQTGGIWVINTKCATSLRGLYVAGDCCATRAGGAIMIGAGWSLSGAAVTGKRAAEGAAEYALQTNEQTIGEEWLASLKKIVYSPTERTGGFSPRWVTQLLQNTMMPYFILHIKHGKRLQAALTIVEFLRDLLVPKLTAKDSHELRLAHETKNMVLNAEMILRASLFRTESRSRHYREDYPRRDDPDWLAWTKIKEDQGRMTVSKETVPEEWWPDLTEPYEKRYPRRFPGEKL